MHGAILATVPAALYCGWLRRISLILQPFLKPLLQILIHVANVLLSQQGCLLENQALRFHLPKILRSPTYKRSM